MENFKQIAEDCLAGKLSGTFVLRNGKVFHSKLYLSATSFYVLPYCIAGWCYSVVGNCYHKGLSARDNDVIDFIPDMKKEQITIDIPEGMTVIREETPGEIKIKFVKKPLDYHTVVLAQKDKHQFIHVTEMNEISKSFNKKAEVLSKLTNIRNYFGKPDNMSEGWCIAYSKHYNTFTANYINDADKWFSGILFKEGEHAEQAIKMLGDELKYLFEPW